MNEHTTKTAAETSVPSPGLARLEFPGFFDLQVNGFARAYALNVFETVSGSG